MRKHLLCYSTAFVFALVLFDHICREYSRRLLRFWDTRAVGTRADYAQAGRRATYLARFTAIRQESKTSRKVLPQDSTRSNHPGQARTELRDYAL